MHDRTSRALAAIAEMDRRRISLADQSTPGGPPRRVSKRKRTDKPSYTVAEINQLLDRRFGRRNYVRDTAEDVWIVRDEDHSEGRGFHVVTRDGAWERVVIGPMELN